MLEGKSKHLKTTLHQALKDVEEIQDSKGPPRFPTSPTQVAPSSKPTSTPAIAPPPLAAKTKDPEKVSVSLAEVVAISLKREVDQGRACIDEMARERKVSET